jgi:clorobiocin biosynthesis protein CloN5
MNETEITAKLTKYIQNEFLKGIDGEDLNESTPLLGRGILDSLRVMLLLTFIRDEMGVEVSPAEVDPENLKDIQTMAKMIRGLPSLPAKGGMR